MKYLKLIPALLLCILFGSFTGSNIAVHALSANNDNMDVPPFKIVVRAEGSVEVLPDLAEVFLQIEYADLVKDTAENMAFELFEKTKSQLMEKGIAQEKIKKHSSYTYPCKDSFNNDYRTNIHFSFSVENLNDLQSILEDIENDYVTTYNVNYKVSNHEQHYLKALRAAIENSAIKAHLITGLDHLSLVKIEEDYNYCCDYVYREYNKESIEEDISTPIKITASIQATYIA